MGQLTEDVAFHSNIPVPLDITVAVVYSVFGICSLFGNTTLLYISYKKRNLLKPAEYFIINLAVSDLGLTLSLYPMAITSSFYHRWLYGKTVCSVYAFCGMLFGICSLTTLTLLSMVCFVKVCYPLYGNRFYSVHGRLLIACAWVYALLFACAPLAHWGEYGPEPYGTACCIDWGLSNQLSTARSYTVVLFIFCYILPCCAILASYTGILVIVYASRKTMEQHASRQTHMSSIQMNIVKLSVAVCIGFLAAWSPYAVVSMWAAFGHIENISPAAFAIPAMFAKSSTIYNPIIYLMLRPNFRRILCRDLSTLCQVSIKGCICPQCQVKCCLKPKIRVRLRAVHRQTIHFASPTSPQPQIVTLKGQSCEKGKDVFECFKHTPQIFGVTNPAASGDLLKDQDIPVPLTHEQDAKSIYQKEKSLIAATWGKRTLETDNFCINLEMVQRHAKVAWP
ncbi:opsin 7, group member a [Archocentrus centrarchus]|uniref:opsin 7, group member a n=1 Tax=Archocentrus centrarchus TaxID=63155 RepID=UPI0011E9BC63|nr:opsin-5-like [Archocentrus centrarchus]